MTALHETGLEDGVLLDRVTNGDETALAEILQKYKPLVKKKAEAYYMAGADKDDIIQEGMIGLYKAVRDYDKTKYASFFTFASLCVTRQMISALKLAGRKKHRPLNTYVPLDKPKEPDTVTADLREHGKHSSPEDLLIHREQIQYMERAIGAVLSRLECRVLALYLDGQSYTAIAARIGKPEKSVDNAIQRIRKKVGKMIQREG